MEFGAEYLENSDMFTLFFGQDECSPLVQLQGGEQKSIDNVLVEKFSDYGVHTAAEIDTNFEDVDSLFDNEWMTSKIDLTCLPEQLDSNFNLGSVDNEIQSNATSLASVGAEIQSPSIVMALLADKTMNIDKLDRTEAAVTVCIDECASEEADPPSPEQHVPDVDTSIDEQFKVLFDSMLAASKTLMQEYSHMKDPTEDDVFIAEPAAGIKVPLKRKMPDPVPEGPKPKVKTPEQKQRKRLQNRNAATRYRSKKRSEQDILNAKCLELESENVKLREKAESKKQEIQYLKNLIIDVFSKKHAG